MSSTSKKSGRKGPRSELIVTRHRSAQSTRKSRRKEQVNAGASKPACISTYQGPKSQSSQVNQSVRKKIAKIIGETLAEKKNQNDTEKNNEFYPQKLKRTNFKKRTFLKFKQLQKVLALNKRKQNTPRKEQSYVTQSEKCDALCSRIKLNKEQTLDIPELVRLTEEMEPLSNEDLMEILTCPSPVWWEDPPDGVDFDEEPITHIDRLSQNQSPFTNDHKGTTQQNKSESENKKHTNKKTVNKKRSLETLLDKLKEQSAVKADSIANETNKPKDCTSIDKSTIQLNKQTFHVYKSHEIKDTAVSNSAVCTKQDADKKTVSKTADMRPRTKSVELNKLYKQLCKENASVDKHFKSDDKSTAVNSNKNCGKINDREKDIQNSAVVLELGDEAMLTDLENCTIPIEGANRKRANSDCIIIEDTENTAVKHTTVPKVLPKLVKYSKASLLKSPLSSPIGNFDSDVELSAQDADTISDTNVKFLSDDQVSDFDAAEDKSERQEPKDTSSKQETNAKQVKLKNCLTVYKITEDRLSSARTSNKLDLIYKQCKNKVRSDKVIRSGATKVLPSSERIVKSMSLLKSANGS